MMIVRTAAVLGVTHRGRLTISPHAESDKGAQKRAALKAVGSPSSNTEDRCDEECEIECSPSTNQIAPDSPEGSTDDETSDQS